MQVAIDPSKFPLLYLPTPPPVPIQVFAVPASTPGWFVGVSIFISCLALVASIVAGLIAYAKLQADTLLGLVRESSTAEFQQAIEMVLLLPMFENAVDFHAYMNVLQDDARKKTGSSILLVSEFFDRVGSLVACRHILFRLILPTYGTRIVESWAHLKPILSDAEPYKIARGEKPIKIAKILFPNNFAYLADRAGRVIPEYSELQRQKLVEKFRRIADGTATAEDWIF